MQNHINNASRVSNFSNIAAHYCKLASQANPMNFESGVLNRTSVRLVSRGGKTYYFSLFQYFIKQKTG